MVKVFSQMETINSTSDEPQHTVNEVDLDISLAWYICTGLVFFVLIIILVFSFVYFRIGSKKKKEKYTTTLFVETGRGRHPPARKNQFKTNRVSIYFLLFFPPLK